MKKTIEQKMEWIKNATADELLHQYVTFVNNNHYGVHDEDIKLVHDEIVRRMENN